MCYVRISLVTHLAYCMRMQAKWIIAYILCTVSDRMYYVYKSENELSMLQIMSSMNC